MKVSTTLVGILVSTLSLLPSVVHAAQVAPIDPKTGLPQPPVAGVIPKVSLAAIALSLFGIWAVVQWIHFARLGQKFMLTLTIGTTAMAIGFGIRIAIHYNSYSLGVYIVEDLLILLSPTAFFACDYLLLTKISVHLGEDIANSCLLLPVRVLVKLFVISDISTFLIQAAGGGMSAIASIEKIGEKIALVGLILQLISFFSFTLILLFFGYKVRTQHPLAWKGSPRSSTEPSLWKFWRKDKIGDWKVLYWAVCWTTIGFLTRSAFRIVEFSQGYFGYIPTHEAYFYILDSLPLYLAITIYAFIWPTRCVRSGEALNASGSETGCSGTGDLEKSGSSTEDELRAIGEMNGSARVSEPVLVAGNLNTKAERNLQGAV